MTDWRVRSDDDQLPVHERDPDKELRRNAASIATEIELEQLAEASWRRSRAPDHVALEPPNDERHPVTGRRQLAPEPALVELGRHLRRGRRISQMSQEQLGARAGIDQSTISRAERGLAPSMGVDRLAQIGRILGRAFPLGVCPHEHDCPWQPIVPPSPSKSRAEAFIALVLGTHKEA